GYWACDHSESQFHPKSPRPLRQARCCRAPARDRQGRSRRKTGQAWHAGADEKLAATEPVQVGESQEESSWADLTRAIRRRAHTSRAHPQSAPSSSPPCWCRKGGRGRLASAWG